MATKYCPRCDTRVNNKKDKSMYRWKWSTKHPPTYVCLSCEAELLAKPLKTTVVYTEAVSKYAPIQIYLKIDAPLKKIKRKKKLCPQCKDCTFLIGVLVYSDHPRGPLVCSNKCKLRYRKAEREEAVA